MVTYVVVNDYRNAMIDAETLRGLARTVQPISGTCVCCDSREDLLTTLVTLTLPPGSVVLLEANGTADTGELLEILTADRRTRRYTLPLQVTAVDAKRWQKRYWNNGIEAVQVRTASLLLMTRRDEVNDRRWSEVRTEVSALNPRAAWIDQAGLADRLSELVRTADQLPPRRFQFPFGEKAGPHHHHHHDHHFASMELRLPPRVTRAGLTSFLQALPPEVVRAKGVAMLEEPGSDPVVFQKVEGRDAPAFMTLRGAGPMDPAAVLIGAKCPADVIERLAAKHLHPAARTAVTTP